MSKRVIKRLEVLEHFLSVSDESREEQDRAAKVQVLLKRYDEFLTEFRKLPIKEQQRLEKQEKEEFLLRYSEWHKAHDEWRLVNGDEHVSRESWQAYVEWSEAWNLEWEKTHVKSHDNALILAKTGGD